MGNMHATCSVGGIHSIFTFCRKFRVSSENYMHSWENWRYKAKYRFWPIFLKIEFIPHTYDRFQQKLDYSTVQEMSFMYACCSVFTRNVL